MHASSVTGTWQDLLLLSTLSLGAVMLVDGWMGGWVVRGSVGGCVEVE